MDLISADVQRLRDTNRSNALPVHMQVMTALSFYAVGENFISCINCVNIVQHC